MWEIILFIIAALISGWLTRGVVEHRKRPVQVGEPELMWFNSKESRWERVTSMQLSADGRVVATVPIRLVIQSKECEELKC